MNTLNDIQKPDVTHAQFLRYTGFWFLVSGFWIRVSDFSVLASGFRLMVSILCFMIYGFWGLVYGYRFLGAGLWLWLVKHIEYLQFVVSS